MKSRPDPTLDIRSVHEAGHAIAAVRNRVAFSYVSIERDLLPGAGFQAGEDSAGLPGKVLNARFVAGQAIRTSSAAQTGRRAARRSRRTCPLFREHG